MSYLTLFTRYALLILVFCHSISITVFSQEIIVENNNPQIIWQGQFPDSSQLNKDRSVLKGMADLILGKKPTVVSKPFAVAIADPYSYWVVDQGSGLLYNVKDGKETTPKIFEKSHLELLSLIDLCVLPNNDILFTDSRLNKIFCLDATRTKLYEFGDSLKLNRPTGIAFSSLTHEIWVVETTAHRICILNEKGQFLRYLGQSGTAPGEFNCPANIWIDKNGIAYIVDAMNFRIQIFNASGQVISVFGKTGDGSGDFSRPKGIAVDSKGNIYVADAIFNVIQVFNDKGVLLYVFGGQGRQKEEFWFPTGIFIDENDFIYITDTYNSRIQIFKYTDEK